MKQEAAESIARMQRLSARIAGEGMERYVCFIFVHQ